MTDLAPIRTVVGRTRRHWLLTLALAAAIAPVSQASAREMVSVSADSVNMREGPGTRSAALWQLPRGYPLQVLARRNGWVQVRDFENDRGWVAAAMTSKVPHHVVKSQVANVRSGPEARSGIVGKATYGEVVRTMERRGSWLRVARTEGPDGWIASEVLWGW
ncbi:MAG: hypothetical protein RIS35_3480 [Pseudomonadota bacterium]|jgi:SH3-like domain-containing protein